MIGFAFCGLIWFNLNIVAKTVGGIWFAVGILYVGFKTNCSARPRLPSISAA